MERTTVLKFPTDFVFKIMGKNTPDFSEKALSIVQTEFPTANAHSLSKRPSKNGVFLSLSIKVHAKSQAQLDAVYQKLSDSPDVMVSL